MKGNNAEDEEARIASNSSRAVQATLIIPEPAPDECDIRMQVNAGVYEQNSRYGRRGVHYGGPMMG